MKTTRRLGFWVTMLLLLMNAAGYTQDLNAGLEGYWNFDAYEGEFAEDLSGNGRDAAVSSGFPIPIAGKVGNGVHFDGFSDFTVPWKGIGGNDPRSISFWVKTSAQEENDLKFMGWGTNATGRKWHILANFNEANGVVGAIRIAIAGSYSIGTKIINDGQWHHIAATFEGEFIEGITFYVDGELDPISGTGNPELPVDTAVGDDGLDVLIGSRFEGEFDRMVGELDEVRIYNRVLTANEIQTLFADGAIEQSYAVRSFSNSFASNSLPVDVTLDIQNPIEGVLVETLPAGWSATNTSNGGTLDGSTISWNLTPSTTSVSYTATPAEDTSAARFSGKLDGLYTAGEVMITVIQGQVGEFDFHADIGNVGAEGSSTYNEGADEYSIIGSGANIGGSEDAFHFAFSELEGPFRMAGNAYLDPMQSTHDNIKAGLMVRNNLSTGSSYGFLQIRTDFQMRWQQRLAQGNASQQGSLLDDQFGDMILERNGQTISYYYINLDGQETFMGSSTLGDLDDPVYAGLAVTSHEQGNLSNLLFTQLNIELIDFDAKRLIQLDESGFAKFGETLTVQINVYNRNDSQVSVTETVPEDWEVGAITPSAGQATINAAGQVEWSIDSLLGEATLSYEITTPTDAETAEIVGQFSGEANGNAIGGDTAAIVRGLLPEDVLNQQDIESGLVAQWTLDEGSGATVADSSGQGHDGSFLMGEPAWVEGIRGAALEFDGDDAVEIGWLGIGGADPRTITAWVKTNAGNPDAYIGWGSASAGNGAKWHLLIRGNGLLRTAIAGTNINGSTILNDGQWHFIAVVLPNGKTLVQDIVHYVDGVEDVVSAIATMDVPVNTSTDEGAGAFHVRLGSRDQNGDHFFEGIIDEIRIYNRGLSTKEVQAVMVNEGGYPTAVQDFMLY